MATLDTLQQGTTARILDVLGDDAVSVRLLEMGLTAGESIELIGIAPLGDPMEFQVRGYRISLRRSEAAKVQIDDVAGGG